MCGKQQTVIVEILENDELRAVQVTCIKGEFDRHRAGWFLRGEYHLRTDFLSGCVEEYLAGCLVHQHAGNRVFLIRLEVFIRNLVRDRNLAERIDAVPVL